MSFDTIIDRKNTCCDKWDYLERYFGEKDMLGLWVADMDFAVPQPVLDAIIERASHPIYGYTEIDDHYYDGLIAWCDKRFGYHIEKEWIVYMSGIIPAINYMIQAFTQPGDKIIIQEPVYHPFKNSIVGNDRVPLINELRFDGEKYQMDLAALEEQIDERTKMMILCNPHNPVGRVWEEKDLTALGELCIRRGILLISDEIHADIVYPGHRHIPIASLRKDFADICITCNAPTKTFNLAGLQGANIIISNPDLRKQYTDYVDRFHLQGPTPITMAAQQAAYAHGEPWLEELLVYLEGNVRYVEEFLKERLPGVTAVKPEGTYMIWLDFRGTGMTMEQINDTLIKKAKVAFNDGYMFGQSGACFQRMNIACPRAILQECMERMEKAFNNK